MSLPTLSVKERISRLLALEQFDIKGEKPDLLGVCQGCGAGNYKDGCRHDPSCIFLMPDETNDVQFTKSMVEQTYQIGKDYLNQKRKYIMKNTNQSVSEFLKSGGKVQKLASVPKPAWSNQKVGQNYSVSNLGRKQVSLNLKQEY